jgi:hypothetical protein
MLRLALTAPVLLAVTLAACSSDPITPGTKPDATVTNKDATTTPTTAMDASAPDATESDAGMMSSPDAAPVGMDAPGPRDAVAVGPTCTELEMCCGTLALGQQQCFDRVAAADETGCQMLLTQVQGFGQCLPAGFDAGERPDGAALSPECAQLAPCCAQAGALQAQCDGIVGRDNPGTCQTILDLLAGRGIMCAAPDAGVAPDASAPDATVPDPDAGPVVVPDSGTSTVTDAG